MNFNGEIVLTHVSILNAKRGNSAQSDRGAPAGNQRLICLRSLLINMDNFDPQNGWRFLSNWITVSLLASKCCRELIPSLLPENIYIIYVGGWFLSFRLNCNLVLGCETESCLLGIINNYGYMYMSELQNII